MTKSNRNTFANSWTDNDSGIGLDQDYSSSDDLRLIIEPPVTVQTQVKPFPIIGTTGRKRIEVKPLIRFPSDGIIERIRPATLKNSENSDFIICQTDRGTYIAHRTPLVPDWVTRLVHEIELREQ